MTSSFSAQRIYAAIQMALDSARNTCVIFIDDVCRIGIRSLEAWQE